MLPRRLIVNADDFGFSEGVTRAILKAHREGIVTSTSLMVRHDGARVAAEAARAHPRLSVGLHLDLGEWRFENGEWVPVYEVVSFADVEEVGAEVERQLGAFVELMGGMPTHLDSHQHVHKREPTRGVARAVAERLGVPLRHETPGLEYRGDFYGQTEDGQPLPERIEVPALLGVIAGLGSGATELACHPGEGDDRDTMYGRERAIEAATLCDPRVRAAIEAAGIVLISFRGWRS
jgi:predicted glycoside hydrolase/deacetylase ChbG (UPF0249 family)